MNLKLNPFTGIYKEVTKMKSYKNKIKELRDKCDEFLQQVNSLGNECAWTDRKLEAILELADKIKKDYYEEASL